MSDVTFENVYNVEGYKNLLYSLLSERKSYESISHEEMPTYFQHEAHVDRVPYWKWWFIRNNKNEIVGSLAVTKENEIAIAIFEQYRLQKYATKAITKLLEDYPHVQFLANINPANAKSIDLFNKFGFVHIQNTYKLKRL